MEDKNKLERDILIKIIDLKKKLYDLESELYLIKLNQIQPQSQIHQIPPQTLPQTIPQPQTPQKLPTGISIKGASFSARFEVEKLIQIETHDPKLYSN